MQLLFPTKKFTEKEFKDVYPYIEKCGQGKYIKSCMFFLRIWWFFVWHKHITIKNILYFEFPHLLTITFIYKLDPGLYHYCDRNDGSILFNNIPRGTFTLRGQAIFIARVYNALDIF